MKKLPLILSIIALAGVIAFGLIFIARKAMNIDSLGEGKIDMLYANGLVKNIADLYSLTYEQLFGLEKVIEDEEGKTKTLSFREKTVQNILSGIEASKQVPFERVLFALGKAPRLAATVLAATAAPSATASAVMCAIVLRLAALLPFLTQSLS